MRRKRPQELMERRRSAVSQIGTSNVVSESGLSHPTVLNFINGKEINRETEFLLAAGSVNAIVSKIESLKAQISALRRLVPHVTSWYEEMQG